MREQDEQARGPRARQFAVHIAADHVERFKAMCRAIGIAFEMGGRVRIRDWRNNAIREGRSFIFRRREDLETILGYEQYLKTHQQLAS